MKKTTITIQFDQEKLRAIQFYMSRKSTVLEDELACYAQRLYEKYVPPATREYIESAAGEDAPGKPSRGTEKGGESYGG